MFRSNLPDRRYNNSSPFLYSIADQRILISEILKTCSVPKDVVDAVDDIAGGNLTLTVEVIRHWVEKRSIPLNPQSNVQSSCEPSRVAHCDLRCVVPNSTKTFYMTLYDCLTTRQKQLIRMACVFRDYFTIPMMECLVERAVAKYVSPHQIKDEISQLQKLLFLRRADEGELSAVDRAELESGLPKEIKNIDKQPAVKFRCWYLQKVMRSNSVDQRVIEVLTAAKSFTAEKFLDESWIERVKDPEGTEQNSVQKKLQKSVQQMESLGSIQRFHSMAQMRKESNHESVAT